jgi:RNA polymerase II subunit A small phosphatase-like protein
MKNSNSDAKLLILDLDETLVYGSNERLPSNHDFQCCEYFIYKRPFVEDFLDISSRLFDLAIWTSSTREYAQCIQSELFQDIPLKFLWARERCTRRLDMDIQEYYWIKDLKKVKRAGFDLEKVLMVDDTPRKLERNFGNLIIVKEFTGDPSDRELPRLVKYLRKLANRNNLRRIEKRTWRDSLE